MPGSLGSRWSLTTGRQGRPARIRARVVAKDRGTDASAVGHGIGVSRDSREPRLRQVLPAATIRAVGILGPGSACSRRGVGVCLFRNQPGVEVLPAVWKYLAIVKAIGVPEAAGLTLDAHDLAAQPFGHTVGDRVLPCTKPPRATLTDRDARARPWSGQRAPESTKGPPFVKGRRFEKDGRVTYPFP